MTKAKDPIWVDKRDVLALHEELLIRHGGAGGVRDERLLESALARPEQNAIFVANIDLVQLAALYIAGIVKNHPFVDGNKRVGFVAGVLFLELNGYFFRATEAEAAQAVLELAAGTVDEAGFTAFLRDNVTAPGKAPKRRRS
jgi:death-on-curing protein